MASNNVPGRWSVFTATGGSLSERLRVDSTGDTHTNDGTISSLSDSSAKRDITPFQGGLSEVLQLTPKKYYHNGRYSMTPDDGVKRIGFIAHEVAAVAPPLTKRILETVYRDSSGVSVPTTVRDSVGTVNQVKMIPYLVNAIKDLKTLHDIQETMIVKLQTQIGSLKALHAAR